MVVGLRMGVSSGDGRRKPTAGPRVGRRGPGGEADAGPGRPAPLVLRGA